LDNINISVLQVQVLQASWKVVSGPVKKLKFLFEELEINLLNKICIFLDVITISEEKIKIGLQVLVLQASRSTLDR
jgi:hypothetical protein